MDSGDLMNHNSLKLLSKLISLCVNVNVYFLREECITLIKFSNVKNAYRQ